MPQITKTKNPKISKWGIYWLDADKIYNYLDLPIRKRRPFVCVDIRKINNDKFYYFIPGTSKNPKHIKVKNFSKFYIKIDNSSINKLNKPSFVQVNILYIIKYKDLNNFISEKNYYIGKILSKEKTDIAKQYNNAKNQEICSFTIYSRKFSKWFIGSTQANFKEIASANKKRKKEFAISISKNIKNGAQEINNLFPYKPYRDDLFKFQELYF